MNMRFVGMTFGVSAALILTGCGNGEATENGSNESISEQLNYTITGIEPGAGVTGLAHQTVDEYENLAGWELEESSTGGMLTMLDQAIENEEPIVVTGWTPHWMFSEYDLKYLEDPKGTMGEVESIHTIARLGFEEENPDAYQILDTFHWEVADMEAVMLEAQGSSFEEASTNWVEANQEQVDVWLEGTEQVDGEEIEIVSTQWGTEKASSTVMKSVLEQQGYEVTLTDIDPAFLFEAIANGEADASLSPWLPTTHASFYEKNKDEIVDLGENLTGTRTGFVVPAYMDIDSIEDLELKE
ncbi:glycine betaine/proline transport system substrate-binding protein [Carnobacterium alterfunditum]|uniref:Glycine betaine/proline transport system substrate-binding protein n=1 Tax=Carnobacterium alterfunditum TaxID=28230 RepID=A0A1N6F5C7_9LACT|nr:glycine betaine ABC transporter substrate-binding protein [Carnobacterium alterfunditum]SIN90404.1 glycine betaine/proline transport system substrate-binding protein [Carnobacterium alterfunditum]